MRILLAVAAAAVVSVSAMAAQKEKAGDAAKGKGVFEQQCVMCHNAQSAERKVGPGLKGLFQKPKLANGKKATEQNIRAQIDEGGNGMPAYKDILSAQERDDLIAYLKTL